MNQWTQADWVNAGLKAAIAIAVALVIHFVVSRAVRRVVSVSRNRALRLAEDTGDASATKTPVVSRWRRRDAELAPPIVMAPSAATVIPDHSAAMTTDRSAARAATLGHGLVVLVDGVLLVTVVFMVLDDFGINLAPLIASAGIGGIALGFGAQSLIKDLLSGIFLVMEDQYGLGDVVTIGTLTGTVESVGLRVTRLHDANGQIWYVRNGEIATLGNKTQGLYTGQVQVTAPVSSDPFRVLTLLQQVAADLNADPEWRPYLLEPPEVLGLTSFDTSQMTFTFRLICPATLQGGVERELRARALQALQQAVGTTGRRSGGFTSPPSA